MNPNDMQFIADRRSWSSPVKTIDGKDVVLVARQKNRRTLRKKRDVWVYNIRGTEIIVYNQSRNGVFFMNIAGIPYQAKKFYQAFVEEPVTEGERNWLNLNGYELL